VGSTPQQKDRFGSIGAIAGALGGPASAIAGASAAGGEIGQLKLLERAMNAPAADIMEAGTSLAREQGIRRGAAAVLKDTPKTAECAVEPTAHGNVVKISDDGQTREYVIEGHLDSSAPGSMLEFLAKQAAAGQGFLRELPVGRILGGALLGGAAGNFAAGKDKKNEGKYTVLGALGGAGLAHGFAPAAAAAEKGLGAAAGHEAGALAAGFKSKKQHLTAAAGIIENEQKLYGGVDFSRLDNELAKTIPIRHEREGAIADALAHPRYGKSIRNQPAGWKPLSETYDFASSGEPTP
jgi:hypothetical protein